MPNSPNSAFEWTRPGDGAPGLVHERVLPLAWWWKAYPGHSAGEHLTLLIFDIGNKIMYFFDPDPSPINNYMSAVRLDPTFTTEVVRSITPLQKNVVERYQDKKDYTPASCTTLVLLVIIAMHRFGLHDWKAQTTGQPSIHFDLPAPDHTFVHPSGHKGVPG